MAALSNHQAVTANVCLFSAIQLGFVLQTSCVSWLGPLATVDGVMPVCRCVCLCGVASCFCGGVSSPQAKPLSGYRCCWLFLCHTSQLFQLVITVLHPPLWVKWRRGLNNKISLLFKAHVMISVRSKNYFAATWMDFGVRALRIRNEEEFADAAQCRQTFCRGHEIGCWNQGRWSVRWQIYSPTLNSQSKSSKKS